jgi:DNA-binding FadR family transcriptional regulator
VVEHVRARILSGDLSPGAALPPEAQLSEQFGVSRSVVRDACRVLMAQGLVEIKHGAGTFVTDSQDEAFSDALLLALKRAKATVWDVEQFEAAILPEVIALAAERASARERKSIRERMDRISASLKRIYETWWGRVPPQPALDELTGGQKELMRAIYAATHNRVFAQLAEPLSNLRSLRKVATQAGDLTPEAALEQQMTYFERLWDALTCGDPAQARERARALWHLPEPVAEVMRQTPIGEMPLIERDRWAGSGE